MYQLLYSPELVTIGGIIKENRYSTTQELSLHGVIFTVWRDDSEPCQIGCDQLSFSEIPTELANLASLLPNAVKIKIL